MDDKLVSIGFMATAEQKKFLGEWAKIEDRSVSAVLRRLIDQEAERRQKANGQRTKVVTKGL
jgi:hypothetical protein